MPSDRPRPRPFRRARGSDGQWLLLTAVVAAIGLGVIMVLLNTAVLNGHSSLISITSFPKNDIRDLRSTSIDEAVLISNDINGNATIVDKKGAFNASYARFVDDIGKLYHAHSSLTDVRYVPQAANITLGNGDVVSQITNVSLVIAYYNGDTFYTENVTVGV